MPATARRLHLDGYVRVSDVRGRSGPSFISPALQRERIEAWCDLYNARLGAVFEELDESGRRADRPLLEQALERIELGASDGIIVAFLSRFGRSLADSTKHLARIQAAGGTFISVQEQFDLDTDHGRLMLRQMLAYNEYESDRIRSNWDDARRRATARGVHNGPYPPVGYKRRPDGRLRVDYRTAEHIRRAFAMRVDGASLADVGRYLREHRVRSGRRTMVWQPSSVERIFASRVYLGEIHNGPYVCVDAHPALVDPVTWRLAVHQPAQRAEAPRPGLLYGILRCATCRAYLTLWSGRSDGIDRMYRCGRQFKQRGACPHRAWITASTMDALAEDLLFAAARRRPQIARKTQSALLRAEREVATAEQRLVRYRDNDHLLEALDQDQYLDGLGTRAEVAREATADLQHLRTASLGVEALRLRGIERRWADMDLAARRQALAWVFDAIFLTPGHGHVEQRIWICERGEAPSGLPTRGRPRPPRPFVFPTAEKKISRQQRRVMAARRFGWDAAEIERRLKDFINGQAVFPTPQQFVNAGQRRLYDHVCLRGGGPQWASRLGVAFDQRTRKKQLLWTEDRLRNELSEFLAGRETWPTLAEFQACGKGQLRRAVVRFGGMEKWATRFGLPMSNFRGPHLAWPEERIEAELRALVGNRTEWPRRREFSAAGLDGCYAALWRGAGVPAWARRIGVHPPPRSRGGRRPSRRRPGAGS
jgi:DNA invertase Pin-like site-specific DNA recombinase